MVDGVPVAVAAHLDPADAVQGIGPQVFPVQFLEGFVGKVELAVAHVGTAEKVLGFVDAVVFRVFLDELVEGFGAAAVTVENVGPGEGLLGSARAQSESHVQGLAMAGVLGHQAQPGLAGAAAVACLLLDGRHVVEQLGGFGRRRPQELLIVQLDRFVELAGFREHRSQVETCGVRNNPLEGRQKILVAEPRALQLSHLLQGPRHPEAAVRLELGDSVVQQLQAVVCFPRFAQAPLANGSLVGEQGEVAVGEGHRVDSLQQAVGGVEIARGDEIPDCA